MFVQNLNFVAELGGHTLDDSENLSPMACAIRESLRCSRNVVGVVLWMATAECWASYGTLRAAQLDVSTLDLLYLSGGLQTALSSIPYNNIIVAT